MNVGYICSCWKTWDSSVSARRIGRSSLWEYSTVNWRNLSRSGVTLWRTFPTRITRKLWTDGTIKSLGAMPGIKCGDYFSRKRNDFFPLIFLCCDFENSFILLTNFLTLYCQAWIGRFLQAFIVSFRCHVGLVKNTFLSHTTSYDGGTALPYFISYASGQPYDVVAANVVPGYNTTQFWKVTFSV